MLLADYEPVEEADDRLVYQLGASMQRGGTDDRDLDAALREAWMGADDRPLCEWHVEVTFDEIDRVAHALIASRSGPTRSSPASGPSRFSCVRRRPTPGCEAYGSPVT